MAAAAHARGAARAVAAVTRGTGLGAAGAAAAPAPRTRSARWVRVRGRALPCPALPGGAAPGASRSREPRAGRAFPSRFPRVSLLPGLLWGDAGASLALQRVTLGCSEILPSLSLSILFSGKAESLPVLFRW